VRELIARDFMAAILPTLYGAHPSMDYTQAADDAIKAADILIAKLNES